MSTITTNTMTSSLLPRAYIGARRNRHYINNSSTSSSSTLANDYFSSTTPLSKSFQAIQSEQENYLSNATTADALQTQQEERAPVKYLASTTPPDERQLHQQEKQKAKGFSSPISSSSSSSSLFLFPTLHNVTPLSDDDHSSSFSLQEQQHFHHPSLHYEQHSYKQPFNIEEQNNPFSSFEKFNQHKSKQISSPYHHLDLSDVPEENTSFSTTYSLTDPNIENNENNTNNQSYLLTSTPIVPSPSPYYRAINNDNNILSILSRDKNYSNKLLPSTFDSIDDQSSTISTVGLITDLQHKADVCHLNNMSTLSSSSSLRYSSNLGTGTLTTHPYDQRITDQGNKYVIQLKTDEYQENDFTVTPRYPLHQIVIDAKHREEDSTGGYVHRELHKIFNIPKHIDLQRHSYTYNKSTQELTIEMPYLQTSKDSINESLSSAQHQKSEPLSYTSGISNPTASGNFLPLNSTRLDLNSNSNNTSGLGTTANDSTLLRSSNTAVAPTYGSSFGKTKPFDFDLFHRSVFRPQIVPSTSNDTNNNSNGKKLLMSLDLSDYQAEDIKVSVKDRELIVKAEKKIETDTRKSRTSFFQSTSLPPQTDIQNLHSNFVQGKLIIEAPYLEQSTSEKKLNHTINNNNNNNNNQPTNW